MELKNNAIEKKYLLFRNISFILKLECINY